MSYIAQQSSLPPDVTMPPEQADRAMPPLAAGGGSVGSTGGTATSAQRTPPAPIVETLAGSPTS